MDWLGGLVGFESIPLLVRPIVYSITLLLKSVICDSVHPASSSPWGIFKGLLL